MGSVVVIGGTSGLGLEIARHYAAAGRDVVITGGTRTAPPPSPRRSARPCGGIGVDLAEPKGIAGALADVGPVDHLVLSAIARDQNKATDYNIDGALYLVTLKLVGYTEVVHALSGRLSPEGSILLFGGQAKERPYPGSTTVTTVNGGVATMITTLALELAPVRVNALHPGIVGDSPYWSGKDAYLETVRSRTPTGKLVTMADITRAVVFLLETPGVNGVNLAVDGGWLLM